MPRTTRSAKRHNDASVNRRQHEEAPLPQPGASSTDANEEVEMPDAPPQPEPSKPAIDDDDLCPICHLLLFRPVRTRCAHTLCQSCMAHWADVSAASAHMAIVPLTDAEPAPDAHPGFVEARCPMCRTVTSAARDGARERALRRKYPGVWVERQREEDDDDGGEGAGGEGKVETVTVFLGNTHKLLQDEDGDGNCHEWSFFVRFSDTEVVEEVQILLHPTFRPPRVIRAAPPYQITRIGWGVFEITAYILLKAGYSWLSEDAQPAPDGAEKGMLPLEWMLSFDGRGSMARCRLKIKNEFMDDESSSSSDDSEWEE